MVPFASAIDCKTAIKKAIPEKGYLCFFVNKMKEISDSKNSGMLSRYQWTS